MNQNDVQIRLEVVGVKSITELEAAIRRMTKATKDAAYGSKEFVEGARQLAEMKNLRTEAVQPMASAVQNLHTQYFKLGTEIRANAAPSVLEFSRIIQDAPFGIRGVANNIQQLSTNFGHLAASAGGTIPAIKSMLSMMTGPLGMMMAVSIVTSLAVAFGDKLFPATKDAEQGLKSVNTQLERQFDIYNKMKGFRGANLETYSQARIQSELNQATRNAAYIEQLLAKETDEEKKKLLKSQYDTEIALIERIADYRRRKAEEEEKNQTTRLHKRFEEAMKFDERMAGYAGKGGRGLAYGAKKRGAAADKVAGLSTDPEGPERTFSMAMREMRVLESATLSASNTMANAIAVNLGNAFASVFGGAQSLLGQFVGTFVSTFVSMTAKAAVSSMFGPVPAPSVRGTNSSVLSELQQLNSFFQGGGMEIKNDAIVYAYERGNQMRKKI